MSYILDALKRADADRERGHVPGLHTRTAGIAAPTRAGQPLRGPRTALLAGLGLALLVAAAAGWWWKRPAPPGPLVDMAASPIETAPVPPRADPAPPAPAPAVNATVAESPGTRPPAPVLPILAPPAAPPVAAPAAQSSRSSAEAVSATAAPVAAAPAAHPPATAPGAATAAVTRFADLPPETRAQLPAVSINGSTYSQNPAHRMLIANGKVVQEGGEIAPGLKLETIGPRSAVLNHQGTRYSIGY